ncbi:MAG: hypothetical protein AAFQ94_03645 [Bacteroidota bacterium]
MTQKTVFTYLISIFIYIVLQTALLNKMVISNIAFCFFYVGFLIYLPFNISRIALLILGFLVGLVIDIFGDTISIHMIACTTLMFVKPFWQQATLGDMGELTGFISMKGVSIIRLMVYTIPLLLLHHSIVFFLDSIGAGFQLDIILRVMLSAIFTFFVLVIIQLFSTKTTKRI